MLPAHFHNAAGDLFMTVENFLDFQNCGMLLSHCVMLLKFVLFSCSVQYFSYFDIIFRFGLLGSSCGILIKLAFINRDISAATSSKWAGSIRFAENKPKATCIC